MSIDHDEFNGAIDIEAELSAPLATIWLNSAGLRIIHATALNNGGRENLAASVFPEKQLVALSLPTGIFRSGHWKLSLSYQGHIGDGESLGLFRRIVDGTPYIFTQSEPIYARRIFPCVDEPDQKVPWTLTLEIAQGLTAVSNTSVVRETDLGDERKRVEFETTRPLPSYLIAFAVGPFEIVEDHADSRIPIRLLGVHGRAVDGPSALKPVSRIITFLEKWFQSPYAYRKLDLVAVPGFGLSAMENPGLVTFDEELMRGDHDRNDLTPARRDVWIMTIGHELAHQWFGNLVTMRWWDDLWLNESFASWIATRIALELDGHIADPITEAHDAVRDLSYPPNSVRFESAEMSAPDWERYVRFDSSRGAALLRLLNAYVGEDSFTAMIRAYLEQHRESSVVSRDVIELFQSAAVPHVQDLVGDYIANPGVPSIEALLRCDNDRPRISVRVSPVSWSVVPVCISYDHDGARKESCAVVNNGASDIVLASKRCPKWIMPARGGVSLARVVWDKMTIDSLVKYARMLTPDERRAVFVNLTDAGQMLTMIPTLLESGDSLSVSLGLNALTRLAFLIPIDLRSVFRTWVIKRYSGTADVATLGHADTRDPLARTLREDAIALLAEVQDPFLAKQSARLIQQPGDIETGLFRAIARSAVSTDPRLAERYLLAVAAMTNKKYRFVVIDILSRTNGIIDILAKNSVHVKSLELWEREVLLSKVCDVSRRGDVLRISEELLDDDAPRAVEQFDECVKQSKTLRANFRALMSN